MVKSILNFLLLIAIFPFIGLFGKQNDSKNMPPPYYSRLYLDGLPLYFWSPKVGENFGDYLSLKLVERITNNKVSTYGRDPFNPFRKKLLAIGSIIHFSNTDDVVWGSGINGKHPNKEDYHFKTLDVRAVRGPLTRKFLMDHISIEAPEIYGDPALLLPYFFPEFERKKNPSREYLIVLHASEDNLFPKTDHIASSFEPWNVVIEKILDSQFVISSSLHGIIVAEAWGIPARLLKMTDNEPIFKYADYYLGTGRPHFQFAATVEEALNMGGEPPVECDLQKLYGAFPFEFWDNVNFKQTLFDKK